MIIVILKKKTEEESMVISIQKKNTLWSDLVIRLEERRLPTFLLFTCINSDKSPPHPPPP